MKNFNKSFLLLFIFSLLLVFIPSIEVKAGVKDVSNLEVNVDSNGKILFTGNGNGISNGKTLLIKIYKGEGEDAHLEFFDQVKIIDDSFSFTATPNTASFGDTLILKITGDLSYYGKFYYSPDYKSLVEEIAANSFDLLSKYAIYYDDTIETKLKFNVDTKFNGKVLFVYLYGTNFRENDLNWQNKDAKTWENYLQTITTKGYEVSKKSSDVYIYVYDKNMKLIQYFPDEAYEAIKKPSTKPSESGSENPNDPGSSQGEGQGEGGSGSGEGQVIDNPKDISLELDSLLEGLTSYKVGEYNYSYSFSVISSTNKYIRLKGIGDFSRNDSCWKNINTSKLEGFLDAIALKINSKYNADIDFLLYDKNGNVLTSYSYYTYKKGENGKNSGSKTSSSTSNTSSGNNSENSGSSSSSSSVSNVDENYKPTDKPIKAPEYYELDENYQFVPWNDKRATGLVLALYLASYGSNSASMTPIVDEETAGGYYVYNMSVTASEVQRALSSLGYWEQPIAYIKKQTDSNNVTMTIPADAVNELRNYGAKFILDTDYYKIELDFSKYNGSGDVVINTSDVDMPSDSYAKPLLLSVKSNGSEAYNSFNDGIKCVIHYDSEKTRNIKDLRSINVFNSNGIMFNSTASTREKGLIFKYAGADTYYAKNNEYSYSGIKDSYSNTAACLIASKGIVMATNGSNFNEEGTITRGEFISLIAAKMGAYSNTQHFANLPSSNGYYKAVNGVYELGILPTTYRKDLDINKAVTVEEAIYMIERCYEVNLNNVSTTSASLLYKDKDSISVWAKTNIAKAAKLGIIPTDGNLYPQENIYRYEVAELFYELLRVEGIF